MTYSVYVDLTPPVCQVSSRNLVTQRELGHASALRVHDRREFRVITTSTRLGTEM
jgi:hypothetical protein